MARKAVADTSIVAYDEIRRGLKGRQGFVFALIYNNPGHTDLELTRLAGFIDPNAVRPRRTELAARGLVVEAGKRRCAVSGKVAKTWRPNDGGPQLDLF